MQSDCCCTVQHDVKPLSFRPVALEDKAWMDKIIRRADVRNSEWCFTGIYTWNDTYHQQVAKVGDRLVVKLVYHERPFYALLGTGDIAPIIQALQQDAAQYGTSLEIRGITPQTKLELEEAFPGQFAFSPNTNAFDYIYEAENLATLAGKKLHAKRNHINRFLENHPNWVFEPITLEALPECIDLTRAWALNHQKNESFAAELLALRRAFAQYEALALEGGLIRVEGEVFAFAIGEPISSDTYIIHFEKACPDIQGAYPMINREFARHIRQIHPHIRYINREDDMGVESLRKAKRSYYPAFMVEKFTAIWRDS